MAPEGTRPVEGITDSKKLSPARRRALHALLCASSDVHIAVGKRSVKDINEKGIQRALRESFFDAIEELIALKLPIKAVRADGKPLWPPDYFPAPTEFIVGGDATDWAIGAASIVAKVRRDAYMAVQASSYPCYDWGRNMGYGTPAHIAGIRRNGLSPLHRVKFCRNFPTPEDDVDPIHDLFGED